MLRPVTDDSSKPDLPDDPWLSAVLRRHKSPAWISGDAPHSDVVLSTRTRVLRNVAGFRFPRRATRTELCEVEEMCGRALRPFRLEQKRVVSGAERALLAGSRLVSPDFGWGLPGRSVHLDAHRSVSVMVNEEDHLRIQSVLAGLSIEASCSAAETIEIELARSIEFLWSDRLGFLASSLDNLGRGRRVGAMLHLPALVGEGRGAELVSEASRGGLEMRGGYGEHSSGTGGFVQVSTSGPTTGNLFRHLGHLINIEREARRRVNPSKLASEVETILSTIRKSDGISFREAVRSLSRLRLGSLVGVMPRSPSELNALLALLGLHEADSLGERRRRARLLRRFFGQSGRDQLPTR